MPQLIWRKKSLERDLNVITDWSQMIQIIEGKKDLPALMNHHYLHSINGTELSTNWTPDMTLTTDASPEGYGAILEYGHRRWETQAKWSAEEQVLTSNQKELKKISKAFFTFKNMIPRGAKILVRTDNTTALSYVNGKGKLPEMLNLIRPMMNSVYKHRLMMKATHIPGVDNEEADELSRALPRRDYDWILSEDAFQMIEKKFGRMAFDLFADANNEKTDKYASWFKDPKATLIDIMKYPWNILPSPWYIVPP